jgi:hypothetical protein
MVDGCFSRSVVRVRDFLRGKLGARGASLPPGPGAKPRLHVQEGASPGTLSASAKHCTLSAPRGLGCAHTMPQGGATGTHSTGSSARNSQSSAELAGHARWARTTQPAACSVPSRRGPSPRLRMTYGHLKGPLPTRKRAIGPV